MSIQNIRRFGSVSAPNMVALKSPSVYIKRITKANPAWGVALATKQVKSALVGGCLWAAAVAVGNACRISEVLRITNRQVLPNGCAWALGSKGSNSRLIYLGLDPSEALELIEAKGEFAVFSWDYQHIYRACLAYGFAESLPNHEHRAVTHAGRYRVAQAVASKAGEAVAGEVLGHKSKTAIEHYTKPQNCKRNVRKKEGKEKFLNLEDLLNSIA